MVCHSLLCSIICLIVKIHVCPARDIPLQNPVCLFCRIWYTVSVNLSKMTRQRNLLVMDRSMIPLQLLKSIRSPFLGSYTMRPIFHWLGAVSVSQIFCRISTSTLGVTTSSVFIISACTWIHPNAFPLVRIIMALITSSSVGLPVPISRTSSEELISVSTAGSSLLSTLSKCSFQHASSFSIQLVNSKPCFLTGVSASPNPLLSDLGIQLVVCPYPVSVE